jgi:hypothetical protein
MRVVNLKVDNVFGVYIGRGGKWGNPFVIGKDGSREDVVEKYEVYARGKFSRDELLELKGATLKCFCKPLACHGDVLVKLVKEIVE